MRVCLYEDGFQQLEPLSLTRAVFDLRCGIDTLGHKQLRYFDADEWGALVRPAMEPVCRQAHPSAAINDDDWLTEGDIIFVNSRWLPPNDAWAKTNESCVGIANGAVAYVVVPNRMATSSELDQLPILLEVWRHTMPKCDAGGDWIEHPWDLVDCNAEEIRRDFGWLPIASERAELASFGLIGPQGNLWLAASARIEPMVVADATRGPVVIDEGAIISAFSRLEGPCYIGPHTHVLGAKIRAGTTLGPHCRVGGEVEASIMHGYSNKYHEGFLGHAYIGEWVNLAAGTHNSDLRNDYGEVTMTVRGLSIATGMTKVGCFVGDHTKTGLGTLLNTGTSIGAFCNVLPSGGYAPKYLPSFTTWWNGSLRDTSALQQALSTAEIVMRRRGVALTDAHKALFAWLAEQTAQDRFRTIRETEQRALRRSA
ncbi:MAG: hypothetical protein FJ303_07190 [Planctomycetes bacterium]|nr:hypothetical protein [Planctomycetota bacterium]